MVYEGTIYRRRRARAIDVLRAWHAASLALAAVVPEAAALVVVVGETPGSELARKS